MNIFALSGFINGISAVIFGLLVYLKNPRQLINKTFGLMTLAIAIWAFGYGFWLTTQNKELALFWTRILSIGSTFIPIFFLHWIFVLLNLQAKRKQILIFGYILTLIFLSFAFTPFYVKDVAPRLFFPWWPVPGIVYNFYLILGYLGIVSYGGYELIKAYNEAKGDLKKQIQYVLLAMIIGFGGGATNFPLWYGIPLLPYGNFLVFLYPLIFSFAILKYHLFEIRVILTELLIVLMGIILLVLPLLMPSLTLKFLTTAILFLFGIFGYLLIRLTYQEIERREELQKAYEELKKLDVAKSEFISIASHQLRTPLTAIKGYISMMLEKVYGELPEKMKKPLENIYTSNERLIKLINDLLNVSKIEAGKIEINFEKAQIEEIIESVIKELEISAKEKSIYLKFEKPEKLLPKITVDKEKIRHVIMNVIDNAIRYTEKGGVTIELKIVNSKLQIVISDTGAGLTKDEISKMFESFSRGAAGTQLYTEGVGLGLYVAKKFIEMHNGQIWAESPGKNKGSKFFIELPIV